MSVVNAAGLVLDGMAFCPETPQLVVVHVHGSLGNFYQQGFIRAFANHYVRHDVALLSFNLTGHDGIAEGYTPEGDMRYVGGSVARFETCLDDLDALVECARSICPNVVLEGHSLGCDRVLFYADRRSSQIPLILLSPCDSHRLHELWLGREPFSDQLRRLSSLTKGDDDLKLLPAAEYGVVGPDGWTYSIPIGVDALMSIVTGAPFDILHVSAAARVVTRAPAFVYMGTEDAIRGAALSDMDAHVRKLLPSVQVCTTTGDHSLAGCEDRIAHRILAWADAVGLRGGASK